MLFSAYTVQPHFEEIKIQFPRPDDETLRYIAALAAQYPGKRLSITFDPAMLPLVEFLAKRSNVNGNDSHPLMWFSILCGGATLSYWTIASGIWKAYGIMRAACGWYRWALPSDGDGIAQSLDELEKVLFRNGVPRICKNDQRFLRTYRRINTILKRLHIRSFFPYDHELETLIDQFHFAKK